MAAVLLAGGSTTATPNDSENVTGLNRSDAERAHDAGRQPHQVMAFYGAERGDKVVDLVTTRGSYTVILAHPVGALKASSMRRCSTGALSRMSR